MRCSSTFEVINWEEVPYDQPIQGPRLARATVRKTFEGDLRGESTAELFMCQADPEDYSAGAGYVASERVVGEIGDRKGSFVIQHGGLTGGGTEEATFGYVVPGSGRGDLEGMHGIVEISKDEAGKHAISIEYHFD